MSNKGDEVGVMMRKKVAELGCVNSSFALLYGATGCGAEVRCRGPRNQVRRCARVGGGWPSSTVQ